MSASAYLIPLDIGPGMEHVKLLKGKGFGRLHFIIDTTNRLPNQQKFEHRKRASELSTYIQALTQEQNPLYFPKIHDK